MNVLRHLAVLPAGRRTKWAVLVFWLVVVALAGPISGRLQDVENNDPSSYLPGSAESTRVLDLSERFTGGNTTRAVVVYVRDSGLRPADTTRARSDARALRGRDFIAGEIIGPVRSADGRALQLVVPIKATSGQAFGDDVDTVRQVTSAGGGLATAVSGPAGVQADSLEVFADIDSTLLLSTLIVVVVILLLTYRSPWLWILPVVAAAISLVCAQAADYLFARHAGLTVNGQSSGILLVLVFGAGTDYALLLIARYREELHRHTDRHQAMSLALLRAGPAIVASGATVILSLLCLLVAELNSNRGLGPVAAVGIACALLAMVTLLPALLVVVGRWVFWPRVPHAGTPSGVEHHFWGRLARAVARRPRKVWISTAVVLGALCVGLVTLDTGGLSNAESFRGAPESIRGQRLLADHFGVSPGSPAIVIGQATAADALTNAVRHTPGIARATAPRRKGELVRIDAVFSAPPDSPAVFDTVDRLRDAVHAVPGARAGVGGPSAVNLDVRRAAGHDTALVIPIVLAVVFCVLGLLLRAVVASLMLIATVVLSFAAALGVSAFVFEVIFGFGGSDPSLPLFAFIFLVALGIDYNIFLMTRVREETEWSPTSEAVVRAVTVTGRVITSAGLVLAATFSVLWVLPLVALAQVSFAVAFGVLLDTLVVRTVLVPALTDDLGQRVWWPSTLARSVPLPAHSCRPWSWSCCAGSDSRTVTKIGGLIRAVRSAPPVPCGSGAGVREGAGRFPDPSPACPGRSGG